MMHGCACPPGACTCGQATPAASSGISVTVNPEARVSAIVRDIDPLFERGVLSLPVWIVNEGLVTGELEAELIPDRPGISLEFDQLPLTGSNERRELLLRWSEPRDVDLTVAFRLRGDFSDLGGRDRIHFIARPAPVLQEPGR